MNDENMVTVCIITFALNFIDMVISLNREHSLEAIRYNVVVLVFTFCCLLWVFIRRHL